MQVNNTTATSNVASAESITKESKISFTDNELQSIAINAMGRASEARNQAVTNISKLIKLFLIFLCSMSFAYAENASGYMFFEEYSGSYSRSKCALPENLNNPKCLHQVYQELDSRLNQAYKNIMNSTIYPQANKTALKNSQIAWIKAKEAECKKFSKNKDKLINCYLDKTIDKINKLWQIEANVIEKPFEGKWLSCFDRGNLYDNKKTDTVCVGGAAVQKGNNICGTTQWIDYHFKYFTSMELHIIQEDKTTRGVKVCNMGNTEYIECYNDYKDTGIPFSKWDNGSEGGFGTVQYIEKKPFKAIIKTPFTQNELNELSKIQWLQDCLNYKGE